MPSISTSTRSLLKRPHLIRVLDTDAIFGAYTDARLPEQRSSMETIRPWLVVEMIQTRLAAAQLAH